MSSPVTTTTSLVQQEATSDGRVERGDQVEDNGGVTRSYSNIQCPPPDIYYISMRRRLIQHQLRGVQGSGGQGHWVNRRISRPQSVQSGSSLPRTQPKSIKIPPQNYSKMVQFFTSKTCYPSQNIFVKVLIYPQPTPLCYPLGFILPQNIQQPCRTCGLSVCLMSREL